MLKTARMRKRKATRKREDRAKAAERKFQSNYQSGKGGSEKAAPKKKLSMWRSEKD